MLRREQRTEARAPRRQLGSVEPSQRTFTLPSAGASRCRGLVIERVSLTFACSHPLASSVVRPLPAPPSRPPEPATSETKLLGGAGTGELTTPKRFDPPSAGLRCSSFSRGLEQGADSSAKEHFMDVAARAAVEAFV